MLACIEDADEIRLVEPVPLRGILRIIGEAEPEDSNFKLLGYIDPYGITLFNGMQFHDLKDDLARARVMSNEPDTIQDLDALDALLSKAMELGMDYFIRIVGD